MDKPLKQPTQGRYLLKTLGCKANLYDSQLIEAELQRRGWSPLESGAPSSGPLLCVVNSCTVTDEADRQSRKMAQRLARENDDVFVVVTGCAAEVDPERIAASKGVDYVIGNRDKPALVELILSKISANLSATRMGERASGELLGRVAAYEDFLSKHPMDREWPVLDAASERGGGQTQTTRAFVKIQDGCDSFCTYCIIPYGRGPSRSLRPREIIESIRQLIAGGAREVVLTGTNIGDYGKDWGETPQFTELAQMILAETPLERLRLSSLDPTEITSELMALMEREPRLCPHFHVSLQSPHSKVLRLMKRRYGFDEVKNCLEKISALHVSTPGGVFVGMDIITGFPGETLEEFEWGLARLRELPWTRLHVFPYSERAGTPATRLSMKVPQAERVRRARVLSDLSFERMREHHERLLNSCLKSDSQLTEVLLEKAPRSMGEGLVGYTRNYVRVSAPAVVGLGRNQLVRFKPQAMITDRVNSDVTLTGQCSSL
jgi:threonylcarbamoyladenosine tRNA methylthiotransferase MtaB